MDATHTADLVPFELRHDGRRLRGWTSCGGPGVDLPVLFVHPINNQGLIWAEVARRVDAGLGVMPDLRGHGGSDVLGPFGLDEWVSDLVATLDHHEIARAHVVGGSLGGSMAVQLAATEPDRVASVACVGSAPTSNVENREPVLTRLRSLGVQEMFRELVPKMSLAPGTSADVLERALELSNSNAVETVAAIWEATVVSSIVDHAERVDCPALVVTGALDMTCQVDRGRQLAELIDAEFVVLPGIGHLPQLEAPDELAAHVARFLRSVR